MQKKWALWLLLGISSLQINAQSRWYVGANGGVALSKTSTNDTLANNFSTRNRIGGFANLNLSYDLTRASSLNLGLGYLNTGYKIANDTMAYNTNIAKGFSSVNVQLGMSLRQGFSSSNYISERFGVSMNYNLDGIQNDTTYNQTLNPRFRLVQNEKARIYPLFYLGIVFGGKTEGGDRYEFNVTYQQAISTSHQMNVQYGEFFGKSFPVNFKGGNVQIGFTYMFNFGNFQKSEEYFYD